MKTLWPIVLAALFMCSCSDDNSSAPDDEEYSDDYGGSSDNGGHKKDSGKDPFGKVDSSKIHTDDLIDIPKVDSLLQDTFVVVTKKELPACSAANEGETFMVDEESALYFCINGEWKTSILGLVKASCAEGVLTVDPFAPSDVAEPVEDSFAGTYRRTAAPIVGVAEKGPFRFGASVNIVELDSAKRMADSQRSHGTCIASGDGSYAFPGVNLVSPYVRVEVNGYFRSELSGGLSPSMVKLYAVTDVTERDTVNVNMLTYLEAPRVIKLVENSGFNQPIRNVKAQALKDVLSAFNISLGGSSSGGNNGGNNGGWGNWNFGGFGGGRQTTTTTSSKTADDVNLFDGDDYSAALLAISIMMQRNGSGQEMLRYADGIAERIKGNGNWDDNQAKADLADWLMELDASGGYERVRNVVKSWGMGEAPDFEKYLRGFWSKTYGFETCNSYTNGQVKNVNTSLSSYFAPYYDHPDSPKIRFICDNSIGAWRVATDVEKDTVGFGAGEYDGQIKNGKINVDKFYVYERKTRSWREATSEEIVNFEDISTVYESLASDETVVFILRHAERTDDTGKNGHLTDNGKKQSEKVGEKLKGSDIYFANSSYTRTYETCENIAKGAGIKDAPQDTLDFLLGEWFVKNDQKLQSYKDANGGGWVVFSKFAYTGEYSDAMYDLEDRSKELVYDKVVPMLPSMKRVNVLISHDQMVVPLVVYFTNKRINLRYYENQLWLNYLAGLAIIVNGKGDVRFVPVRGIDSGTMKQ